MDGIQRQVIDCDVLIIGGGTAGCLAATELKERYPHLKVVIFEKAHIERSGCLAGGMNAINAYLNPGETPESFVKYVRFDSCGLIREDLVSSMAELFESGSIAWNGSFCSFTRFARAKSGARRR